MSLGLSLHDISRSNDAISVNFSVDQTFAGTMQGAANVEGEGYILSGQCVIWVHSTIKISRLILFFEGRCKVHLKKADGYGVTSLSGTGETRSLYNRQQYILGQDGETHTLKPSTYYYPFSFDLPSHLPASFQGTRGYIRYRLTCAIYRSTFSKDLRTSRDITIKRCLMSDLTTLANHVKTVHGTQHTNKIQYSGTATAMVYREGGQIQFNLAIQLLQPGDCRLKSITCALRERVQYRTTDSQSRTIVARSDDSYPLGYNTLCLKKAPDYDSTKIQNYDALIRLIPRVNADIRCRLIQVTHTLVVKIVLQQLEDGGDHTTDENNETTIGRMLQCQLLDEDNQPTLCATDHASSKRQGCVSEQPTASSASSVSHHGIIAPPPPTTTTDLTSSPLGQSRSSSSSFKSIFSLKKRSDDKPPSPKSKSPQIQGKQRHYQNSIVMCTLEIPIVVTSRDDSGDSYPPSYLQTTSEVVPDYVQTLETCPAVPSYGYNDSSDTLPDE